MHKVGSSASTMDPYGYSTANKYLLDKYLQQLVVNVFWKK